MKKVITYGTFDLLHYGHINLLKNAKALGDYLIVAVTSDSFDKQRGKINVQQSLIERIDAVRALNIADKVIVEEYEGQKINDILKYDIDIFTVGSDWVGKFDYLNEYCKVVYLDRTEGVSSTMIRSNENQIDLCLVCDEKNKDKILEECQSINGLSIKNVLNNDKTLNMHTFKQNIKKVDAVFFEFSKTDKFEYILEALKQKKYVYVESPLTFTKEQCEILHQKVKENGNLLVEGNKTYYSTAFNRLCLLAKSGAIGKIASIDLTINVSKRNSKSDLLYKVATAVLPALEILGTDIESFKTNQIGIDSSRLLELTLNYFNYIVNIKICDGIKSEESMVISGTKGYVYVPSPWWKTEYFEIRFNDASQNRRYFYKYDVDSTKGEMLSFTKALKINGLSLTPKSSLLIAEIVEIIQNIEN